MSVYVRVCVCMCVYVLMHACIFCVHTFISIKKNDRYNINFRIEDIHIFGFTVLEGAYEKRLARYSNLGDTLKVIDDIIIKYQFLGRVKYFFHPCYLPFNHLRIFI